MVFLKTFNDCQIELSNEIYLAFNPHSFATLPSVVLTKEGYRYRSPQ